MKSHFPRNSFDLFTAVYWSIWKPIRIFTLKVLIWPVMNRLKRISVFTLTIRLRISSVVQLMPVMAKKHFLLPRLSPVKMVSVMPLWRTKSWRLFRLIFSLPQYPGMKIPLLLMLILSSVMTIRLLSSFWNRDCRIFMNWPRFSFPPIWNGSAFCLHQRLPLVYPYPRVFLK